MFKRLFCNHEYPIGSVKEKCIGVTLGWSGKAEKYFEWEKTCIKCGKKTKTTGYVFGHRKIYPNQYDDSDWPIDADGTRLEIVDA